MADEIGDPEAEGDLQPPAGTENAHSVARALAGDDRPVAVVQQHEGGPITWYVHDARYADGWRQLEDSDEVAALVAGLHAHQAAQAEAVTSGPGPDPVLVKGDDGASLIGTGIAADSVDPLTGAPLDTSTTSNVDLGDGTTPDDHAEADDDLDELDSSVDPR